MMTKSLIHDFEQFISDAHEVYDDEVVLDKVEYNMLLEVLSQLKSYYILKQLLVGKYGI